MTRRPPRIPGLLVAVGVLGLAGVAATFVLSGAERFFTNWIIWFFYALSVGLGALFIVALEHLVGSTWSVPIRRTTERLSGLIPVLVPLGLVALFSLPVIYPWAQPEAAENPFVAGKLGWLNIPMVSARLLISLALWCVGYWVLSRGSFQQDASKDPQFTIKARRFAAFFMIVFAFSLTLVVWDWISALEPLWYSDVFGVYLFAGVFLSGLATTALALNYLDRRGRLHGVRFDHVYSLGGYLFGFTVFWSYIAFAQYMLQWYANLPEEVFWFEKRLHGLWGHWAVALAVIHFVIPFTALVSRKAKGNPRWLARVALVVMVAHFLDLFWLIFPTLGVLPSWQELSFALLFVSAGLIWAQRAMQRGEDMPVGDPRFEAALKFHLTQ